MEKRKNIQSKGLSKTALKLQINYILKQYVEYARKIFNEEEPAKEEGLQYEK